MTDAEWEYLQRALEAATDAIMVAHPGGTLQEGIAVIRGWSEAPRVFSDSPFVQALFHSTPHELRQLNDAQNPDPDRNAEEVLADAVTMCRKAVELLKAKAPEDQEIYRSVVVFLMNKVARAAKEGGFLGIGGQRISEEEGSAIRKITAALE
jgi:CRP-like cAMP-binding protein